MPEPAETQQTSSLGSSEWSRLWALFGDRRAATGVLIAGSVLSGLTEAGLLAILAQSAAALVDGASRVQIEAGALEVDVTLGFLLALAVALALGRLALQVLVSALSAQIVADMQVQLRHQLFAAFTRASWDVQSRDREGHLQELATNQVMQASQGAIQATLLVVALSAFLVLVASALALNGVAALAVLVVAAALLFVLRPITTLGRRRAHALSNASIDYAGGINEAVRLAEETHVFGAAASQRERIGRLTASVRKVLFETQFFWRLIAGVYQSLIYLLVAGALAVLYATGAGNVASLGAVVLLLVRAGSYGQQAQSAYQIVRQSLPFLQRLHEAMDRYVGSSPTEGAQALTTVRTVAFDKMCFGYEPDRPVLSDISFEVADGETVGIVGPSGAGKSTLIQILLGLRRPDSGCYRVNGVSADQFSRKDWHRRVAYVPQQPRLLHASVADNVRFFRPLDDAAVERAARLAGIHDDVVEWSDGYNTRIGPRADAVSGGQQQRICIARALAAEPDILVLDEPTSALDPHSESLIQQSLLGLKHRLILFVVAHRMSTLTICERVMVIVGGHLEAFDHAAALEGTSAYYRSSAALSRPTTAAGE